MPRSLISNVDIMDEVCHSMYLKLSCHQADKPCPQLQPSLFKTDLIFTTFEKSGLSSTEKCVFSTGSFVGVAGKFKIIKQ